MSNSNGSDRSILFSFSYPVYQLKAIGPSTLLTAGGGGNPRTGIPNRIDVIQFDRPAYAPANVDVAEALIPLNTSIAGGLDTKHEAIMHIALGARSPGAASILALEKSTCQEYFLYANFLEPSTIVNKIPTEQESAISSSKDCQNHKHTPSSSSTEDSFPTTGVSSTTANRKRTARKSRTDGISEGQLSWTCKALRNVSIAPTKALIERRRLDSCSSIGDVYPLKDEEDELTCIVSGGPAGDEGAWCAVGTVHGGVALFDRFALIDREDETSAVRPLASADAYASYAFTFGGDVEDVVFPLKPFCILLDASGGRCAPVCDVALSAITYGASATSTKAFRGEVGTQHPPTIPLLATISGRPRGSLLCIWRLPLTATPEASIITSDKRVIFGSKATDEMAVSPSPILYAEVKMENVHVDADSKKHQTRSENGTRFRHCEFLRWIHRRPTGVTPLAGGSEEGGGLFTFLVTTEQPVSPTTRSVCHLSVWLVPLPSSNTLTSTVPQPVLGLERFAAVPLSPGEIPACITVHPSAHRGIIALGSMEGSVEIYMISLHDRSLVRVYSMPKAHPLFVTSLTFLPPRERHSQKRRESKETNLYLLPAHYELVSASADRAIRWHQGPSLERIALIGARAYQPSVFSRLFQFLLILLLVLASPILIALLLPYLVY